MRLQGRKSETEPGFAILEDRPAQRRLPHLDLIPILSKISDSLPLGRHSRLPFASMSTSSTTRPTKGTVPHLPSTTLDPLPSLNCCACRRPQAQCSFLGCLCRRECTKKQGQAKEACKIILDCFSQRGDGGPWGTRVACGSGEHCCGSHCWGHR